MGNSPSSSNWYTSPRLIQANQEALDRMKELGEIHTNLIDSPALLNLEHGTVRYRAPEHCPSEEVRHGYFYHAQLSDWSDPTSIKEFQKMYVTEPPVKHQEQKVYYVYAKGGDSETKDKGLIKTPVKPIGVGYRWRGNSAHLYFRVRFSHIRDFEGSDSETEENGESVLHRLTASENATVLSLSEHLSLKYLVAVERVHIIYKVKMLDPETYLKDLTQHLSKCRVELKKLSDVEIIRHNFDIDEPGRIKEEQRGSLPEELGGQDPDSLSDKGDFFEERDLDGELIIRHEITEKDHLSETESEKEDSSVQDKSINGDEIPPDPANLPEQNNISVEENEKDLANSENKLRS